MRAGIALIGVVLMGCASYEVIDPKTGNALISGSFAGRGCIAVDTDGKTTSAIVQQAARSNWGSMTGILGLADVVGSVFGGSASDREIPDEGDAGCGGLFVEDATPAPPGE